MHLIVGLGNPGEEYAHTRHNAGFEVIDLLAGELRVSYWKSECGALTGKTAYRGEDIVLAKPQSYMNTSGGPLSKLMRELRVGPQEVLVVHDEVDLPQGQVRAKFGGGLNAHNGLRSVADKLGTRDFARLRFGVGRPPGKMSVADYALRQLKGGFLDEFRLTAQDAADLAERCLDGNVSWD